MLRIFQTKIFSFILSIKYSSIWTEYEIIVNDKVIYHILLLIYKEPVNMWTRLYKFNDFQAETFWILFRYNQEFYTGEWFRYFESVIQEDMEIPLYWQSEEILVSLHVWLITDGDSRLSLITSWILVETIMHCVFYVALIRHRMSFFPRWILNLWTQNMIHWIVEGFHRIWICITTRWAEFLNTSHCSSLKSFN